MRNMDLKQGDLENMIMNALWNLESEGRAHVFVANVQERIASEDRSWAYTTVKTVMDRIVEKGLASREKAGKKFYYASSVSREDAAYNALKKMTNQYFQSDLDELLVCVSRLREEGFGITPATTMSREELERLFAKPSLTASMA